MTPTTPAGPASGPGVLAGLRVLELATFITGPQAAALLAQLGADVIKVEPPSGDPFRGPSGYNPAFCAVNFNKRSLVLDLRSEQGRTAVQALARDADVLIENFRPGVVARLGVDYRTLSAANPEVVYCSIGGLDGSEQMAALPAYDSVAQAMSGLLLSLVPAEDPVPVGPPLSDMVTGIFAATAVLGALHRRASTGEGAHVELSMLSSSLALAAPLFTAWQRSGELPDSRARTRRSLAFGLTSSDGLPFVVHVSTAQKFWESLCTAFDESTWREDPRFAGYEDRVRHYDELSALLRARALSRPRAEWIARLRAGDVPGAPAYRLDEVLADPELAAERWLSTATDAAGEPVLGALFPATFAGVPAPTAQAPPRLAGSQDAPPLTWRERGGPGMTA